MNTARLSTCFLFAAAFVATPVFAKTVVCVDGAPDLSGYEGFISTQLTAPPDVVQVGGTLADCMAKLVKGDQLIIIAHGVKTDGPPRKIEFKWQGAEYDGFGDGPGKYPVPPAFSELNGISVTIGSCWSARDPDGAGGQASLTESLAGAMRQNAGNKVTGFTGTANNNTVTDVGNPDRNSAQQIQAAKDWLCANQAYWRNRAPKGNKRNPPPADDEQRAAKRAVDSVFAGKDIPVTIRYTPIRDSREDPFGIQPDFVLVCETGPANCPYSGLIFTTASALPVTSPLTLVVIASILGGTALRVMGRRRRAAQSVHRAMGTSGS